MPRGINLVDEATIQGRLWSPAQFPASTLAVWLDAADTSTISGNASSVIGWRDKSGNERNVSQATTANQPAYTASKLNGKPVLTFNGTSHTLTCNTGVLQNAPGATIASVSRPTGAVARRAVFFVSSSADNTRFSQEWVLPGTSGLSSALRRVGGDSSFIGVEAGGTWPNGVAQIGVTTASYSTSQWSMSRNGTFQTEQSTGQASGNAENVAGGGFSIGAVVLPDGTSFLWFAGDIAEIICTSTALNTTARQRIEGYLAWKWGISRLPASHTFTNRPPLIGD